MKRLTFLLLLLVVGYQSVKVYANPEDDRTTNFKIFDATLYGAKPPLADWGIEQLMGIYSHTFWPKGDRTALPDERWVRHCAQWNAARNSNNHIFLDIEHWPTNQLFWNASEQEVTSSLERLETIVRWIHAEEPQLRVGYYGVLPLEEYTGIVQDIPWRLKREEEDNRRLLASGLGHEVDLIFPSLYVRYSDSADDWTKWARHVLANARRFNKPVYPFLWPRFHDAGPEELRLKPVSRELWRAMLELCRSEADGVVIWGGFRERWDPNAPWWLETQEFIHDHKLIRAPLTRPASTDIAVD